MNNISSTEFLQRPQSLGVTVHPSLENPPYLSLGDPDSARFWAIPSPPRRIPFFISHILNGLDPWKEITLWPGGGKWPETFDPHNVHGEVYRSINFTSAASASLFAFRY